ncbi:hypothetical protein K3495_g6330 [Podosphaera aphanis]|nr:hypothetical protein K3495_g6330 [Podosphaera aphanis]
MRFIQLGAAAPLLGLCQSFLLPPEVTAAQAEVFEKLNVEYTTHLDSQAIHLQCPGCPVRTDIGDSTQALQADNSLLELNFTIQHSNVNQLLLNNVPIYPIENNLQFSPQPLSAPQMIKKADDELEYASNVELAFSTRIQQVKLNPGQDLGDLEVVTIDVDILEAGNVFLVGMPTVELELLKTPAGELYIRRTDILKPQTSLLSVVEYQECSTLLCRWKVMLIASFTKPKGAPKACHDPARSHSNERPHHSQNNSPHYYKPSRRPHVLKPGNIFGSIFYHALVLVIFGVLLSISACLLGGFIGHVVISMWTKVVRHDLNGYTSLQRSDFPDKKENQYKDLPLPEYSLTEEKNNQ